MQRAFVKHRLVVCALAKRGDAADHVAGFAHGDLRIGHRRLLRADCRGQRLQIHMSADRHHADHALGAGVRHQRLEHLMLVETELGGGLNPITVIHVIVRMRVFVGFERNSGFFQLHGGRCGTGALLMLFLAHIDSL